MHMYHPFTLYNLCASMLYQVVAIRPCTNPSWSKSSWPYMSLDAYVSAWKLTVLSKGVLCCQISLGILVHS